MRILHWYPNFFSGGGVANSLKGLLSAQHELGVHAAVVAATPRRLPLYEPMTVDANIMVIAWKPLATLDLPGFTARALPKRAVRAMREFDPDLVHIHGAFNADNLWVPRIFDCPLVLSPHGAFHPLVLRKSRRIAKRVYVRVAQPLLYRRVAAYHAVCPAEERHIREALPGARAYTAPHGACTPCASDNLSNRVSSDLDPIQLTFVGRLDVYTKGLDILLEALALAGTHLVSPLHLALVGPAWGGGMAWLQRRAVELRIAERIRFTGALPAADVAAVLSNTDIYIQLSRHDSFGLSVAEALLEGKPAILSSEIGLTSYPAIASLDHVRVVAPDARDAARAIVDTVQRRAQLTRSAQASQPMIERLLSWRAAAGRHIDHYRSLLS